MLVEAKTYLRGKWKSVVDTVTSRKPHFDFITAHYCWIIGCSLIGSVLIYASGQGNISYINALVFASGANTQAGLNPVDINKLKLAQQIFMYIFPLLSNPITLHGSVVLLRLYWFEKRFQSITRDARNRRPTLTKSKSKARGDVEGDPDRGRGVNGRHITIVPRQGRPTQRVTNDGILLDDIDGQGNKNNKAVSTSDGSDTTVTDERVDRQPNPTIRFSTIERAPDDPANEEAIEDDDDVPAPAPAPENPGGPSITFADTVKRSDGLQDDPTNFVRHRSNTEHIAILERQRNQDNEVLRIPGPRETERGLGPRRLDDEDDNEDLGLTAARTRDSRLDPTSIDPRYMPRNPTITIEEPHHPKMEEVEDDAKAMGSTLESLRMRKPRIFNRGQHKVHEDGESQGQPGATRAKTLETIRSVLSRDKTDDMPYLSYTPTMGRNSNFVGLTLEQREELGGIEYRSLRTLAFILLGYFWGFHLLALTFLLPYILHQPTYGSVVQEDGISRTWWAFWTSNFAFMDVGFTLTPDSMVSFQKSQFVLTVMWWFIIIGNTGFPVMLRFTIWVMAKVVPTGSGLWEELRFLLDHPRRCFTLLFPSGANWWLFWILFCLNVIDLIFFVVLDLNSAVVEDLSAGSRVVNGLFQAASTRTAGFASLPLGDLHPAIPVLYMIMMYISVFPIAISIRRTNVYEEKSLGVYHTKKDDEDDDDNNAVSYVSNHLRRQLSFDLWYVFLGFFILAISEGSKLKKNEFSLFEVLFEVVSAYGTVGMSFGAPGKNTSLVSDFTTVGKLIIVAMEIRGRHRGLPYGLDRAVILPSESRFKKEHEHDEQTMPRTNTSNSAAMSGTQRRNSSVHRGRSMSRDRDRKIISRFLHPGPVVPPGVVHTHHRTRSGGSEAFSHTYSMGSRRPQSFATAIQDDEDDEVNDRLAPLRSNESRQSRPGPPRRSFSEASPQLNNPEWE